jgi:hypothetical protein
MIKRLLTVVACLCLVCGGSYAQVHKLKAKLCGTAIMKDADDKYNMTIYNASMPEPEGEEEAELLEEAKEQVRERFPHKRVRTAFRTTATGDTLVIGKHFLADSVSGIPPDNYMAIDDSNHAVSVVNQSMNVIDATTGAVLYRKTLKAISAGVGLNNINYDYRYDPKIIYDPEAKKFICVMLNGTTGANYIVVGFSVSSNPAGGWHFYKFYGNYKGDTTWFDYPSISLTKHDFFLTGNKIIYDSSWQKGFKETIIYQFDKYSGFRGDTLLDYQIREGVSYNGRNIRCLHPVKPADTLLDNVQYFLSDRNFDVQNDTVFLVKLADTLGGSAPLSIMPVISDIKYGVPPNGRQKDTSIVLATNDGRVLGAYLKANEIQFVSASVDPASGASGIYHGVMTDIDGTPSLHGTIISIDTLDFGYPNISFAGRRAGKNHSIITFNYTGPKTFAGMTGLYYNGTDHSRLSILKTGDSTIRMLTGKEQRWGDYSGSQVKWNNIGEVWVEGIYGRRNRQYGSYMVQLYSPYYGIPENPVDTTTGPPNIYPNPAWSFVNFEFYLKADQTVKIAIYDMGGKLVDRFDDQYCHQGKNVLQFNTAPLPAAHYAVRITGADGSKIAVFRFVKL